MPGPPDTDRLHGLDLARALAVFGMVLVNFQIPLSRGGGPLWLERFGEAFQGRASALFVILAGAGVALMTRRDATRGRKLLLARALFLAFVGYCFALIWIGDILHYYAFYFLGPDRLKFEVVHMPVAESRARDRGLLGS